MIWPRAEHRRPFRFPDAMISILRNHPQQPRNGVHGFFRPLLQGFVSAFRFKDETNRGAVKSINGPIHDATASREGNRSSIWQPNHSAKARALSIEMFWKRPRTM